MARPSKLTRDIIKRIGGNIALGLTYSLAVESAGVTYKTFNLWMANERNSTSEKYHQFYNHSKKCNADTAKVLLEHLKTAAEAGNCQVCMFILERRFSEDIGRHVYQKMDIVSKNRNENVEITVTEADILRKQILAKFDRF